MWVVAWNSLPVLQCLSVAISVFLTHFTITSVYLLHLLYLLASLTYFYLSRLSLIHFNLAQLITLVDL